MGPQTCPPSRDARHGNLIMQDTDFELVTWLSGPPATRRYGIFIGTVRHNKSSQRSGLDCRFHHRLCNVLRLETYLDNAHCQMVIPRVYRELAHLFYYGAALRIGQRIFLCPRLPAFVVKRNGNFVCGHIGRYRHFVSSAFLVYFAWRQGNRNY